MASAPPPPRSRLPSFFRPLVLFLLALGYAALIVRGYFALPARFGFFQIALLIALLLGLAFLLFRPLAGPAERFGQGLEFGLALLLAGWVAVQVTGGLSSPAYPLLYLLFAILAAVIQPAEILILFLFLAGLEGLVTWSQPAPAQTLSAYLSHLALFAAFGLILGLLVRIERRGRLKAQGVLENLKRDAAEFHHQGAEFRELFALSSADQEANAFHSVFALDDAFSSMIELVRRTLPCHTAALYWHDPQSRGYHLREIVSAGEDLETARELLPGQGLLGWAIAERKPLRIGRRRQIGQSLNYYRRDPGIRSLMAAPLIEGDQVIGLLLADSTEPDAFRAQDEKLLLAFSRQLLEIHEHALLLRRTSIEAAKFKGLTELSHKLNATLNLDEILATVLRAARPIVSYDLAAVTLKEEEGEGQVVAAAAGEGSEGLSGQVFAPAGSLVGWVLQERKYFSHPRLREREIKTPVFHKKLDPPGRQSLLGYPLRLSEEILGTVVFLSQKPAAFSPYEIQVAGLIADLAAVAISNAQLYQKTEKLAITDGLTGLYNHRRFQERLSEELARSERSPSPLALLLIDLDHFKQVNDSYGHPVGDLVLRGVARLLKESIRKVDLAARYGGEEFVVLLVDTELRGAHRLAERIREAAARLVFRAEGREFGISLSLGLAAYPQDARRKEDLIERADQALYYAKQGGRNRTVAYASLRGTSQSASAFS